MACLHPGLQRGIGAAHQIGRDNPVAPNRLEQIGVHFIKRLFGKGQRRLRSGEDRHLIALGLQQDEDRFVIGMRVDQRRNSARHAVKRLQLERTSKSTICMTFRPGWSSPVLSCGSSWLCAMPLAAAAS
jgi:hypothetical protein